MAGAVKRWRTRRAVNEKLTRRGGGTSDWAILATHAHVSQVLTDFVVRALSSYSGLEFQYVRPTDDLEKDLSFSSVTHGDWDFDFYEEFKHEFGIDLRKCSTLANATSIEQMILRIAECCRAAKAG